MPNVVHIRFFAIPIYDPQLEDINKQINALASICVRPGTNELYLKSCLAGPIVVRTHESPQYTYAWVSIVPKADFKHYSEKEMEQLNVFQRLKNFSVVGGVSETVFEYRDAE